VAAGDSLRKLEIAVSADAAVLICRAHGPTDDGRGIPRFCRRRGRVQRRKEGKCRGLCEPDVHIGRGSDSGFCRPNRGHAERRPRLRVIVTDSLKSVWQSGELPVLYGGLGQSGLGGRIRRGTVPAAEDVALARIIAGLEEAEAKPSQEPSGCLVKEGGDVEVAAAASQQAQKRLSTVGGVRPLRP